MNELDIMNRCRMAASKIGSRLFRNNVGALQTKDGRYVTYGLAVGSSDLIGFTPVLVTPSMVGKRLAVFTAVEVKSETGRSTEEQDNFISTVVGAGGIAGIARSEEDLIGLLSMHLRK